MPEGHILALIQRVLDGDSQAVAELYSLYYQKVYTFSYYRLGGNTLMAEDITEDTFIRAFGSIRTFKWKGGSFTSWLITIARNLIVDTLRRPEALPLEDFWLDANSDPGLIFDELSSHQDVHQALDKLTIEQKDVIILRFFDDLTLEETSDAIGKSVTSVKRLQARALAAMQIALRK